MGKCRKGKSEVPPEEAVFVCKKCGARTDKKGHVCKPEKVTFGDGGAEKKKRKKKSKK